MGSPTGNFIREARKLGVKVHTRRQWGSKQGKVYASRREFRRHLICPKKPVDTLVQHITVTPDTGATEAGFFNDCQLVERIGMDRFGSGVSYNLMIDMQTGHVAVGQALDAAGTHTLNDKNVAGYSSNQNYVAFAFSFIGMPGNKISEDAVNSVAGCIAALMNLGYLTQNPDYVPHSMFAYKTCPTEQVTQHMARILLKAKTLHMARK